jgi:hypothetical protein
MPRRMPESTGTFDVDGSSAVAAIRQADVRRIPPLHHIIGRIVTIAQRLVIITAVDPYRAVLLDPIAPRVIGIGEHPGAVLQPCKVTYAKITVGSLVVGR